MTPPTQDVIYTASATSDYEAFGGLVREYVDWCRIRYQEHTWFVEQVFGHQSLATELEALSKTYGPSNGKTLLFRSEGQIVGGGAYRRLDDGSCEMKRLFVPSRFRGQGIGRKLCHALLASASVDGFRLMRLDTGNLLTEAIAMYTSFGFRDCAPHHQYPAELMPYLVFMERTLPD